MNMNMNILDMLHGTVVAKEGEIGIEVEVEGHNICPIDSNTWIYTMDASLRGNSMEYLLRLPIPRNRVNEALRELKAHLRESTTIPCDRTGVHIHINCQALDFTQLMNFITLYLVFEGLLVKYCGKEREGNLFCLRADDAEYVLIILQQIVKDISFSPINQGNLRYSSINLAALRKFGSLEFRSLQTPKDLLDIETWINMLLIIKDRALEFEQPTSIIEAVSAQGLIPFATQILGPYEELLGCQDMEDIILKGIRQVQPFAYNFDLLKVQEYLNKPEASIKSSISRLARAPNIDPQFHELAPVPEEPPDEAHVAVPRLRMEEE